MAHRGKNIAQLSVLIQSGHLDPRALAEETLDAIGKEDDQAIFVSVTSARAMAEAESASKRIREGRSCGVLDGIPVAWKDLFDLEGCPRLPGRRYCRMMRLRPAMRMWWRR